MKKISASIFISVILLQFSSGFAITKAEKDSLIAKAAEYHSAGKLDESLLCIQNILSESPLDDEALYYRAFIYLEMNKAQLAISDLDMILSMDKPDYETLHLHGCAQYDLGKYEDAIKENPQAHECYDMRASAYRAMGQHEAAIKDYTASIYYGKIRNADLCKNYTNRALIYLELGEYESVVDDCTEAQKYNPFYITLYLARAEAYTKLGKYEDALADTEYIIRVAPKVSDGFHARGVVYMSMGKYKSAVSDFNTAIENEPLNSSLYALRGVSYMNLNKNKRAIKDLSQAINLSPDNAEWYKFRTAIYIKEKQRQNAIKDLEKSLSLNPNDEQALRYRDIAEDM